MLLDPLRILVVGAGTGGATTAVLLARAGAHVTLIDRFTAVRAVGAGLGLAANGRAILEGMGLGPALTRLRETEGARVTNAQGHTLLASPRGARIGMVSRTDLQRVLLDAALAEPRVTTRFGIHLVQAASDGSVILRADDVDTHERFDLVVGADGARSPVRNGGNFRARLQSTGVRYLRALVAPTVSEATEAWTSAGLFGAIPIDGGTYVYASCGHRDVARALDARDLDALRTAWRSAYVPAGPLLSAVPSFDDLLVHEVVRVDCARWYDGRLVLVGDAAHAMAPNVGQGANSALVDAVVLVRCLRDATSLDEALVGYDGRRRDRVRAVADAAERLGRLAELTSPPLRALRDGLLMPLLRLLPGDAALRTLLQESPATLHALARG